MEEKDIIEETLFRERYVSFITGVERIRNNGEIGYMDSIVSYCTANDIDVESVAGLVNKNPKLKATIREEAESLNFLTKTAKLPI